MTSIGVILCKESFTILKTHILILRIPKIDRFPFQGFPASNREPMINIVGSILQSARRLLIHDAES